MPQELQGKKKKRPQGKQNKKEKKKIENWNIMPYGYKILLPKRILQQYAKGNIFSSDEEGEGESWLTFSWYLCTAVSTASFNIGRNRDHFNNGGKE